MPETIQQLIRAVTNRFNDVSDSARLDAEILLAHVLKKPRSYLFTWPEKTLEPEQQVIFERLVEQRLKPVPIAYLTGVKEFYSLLFKTDPSTLIPRPETEQLVERAIQHCQNAHITDILDLGTGTGAIPIAIKHHCPDVNILAIDCSVNALRLAQENAETHQVNIEWAQSDWFSGIDHQRCFDLIISNPPYIAGDDPWLDRGDLPAEPLSALSPGSTGLESLEIIIPQSKQFLRESGYLLLEHGHDQQPAVNNLCTDNGFSNVTCYRDAAQLPRMTEAQLS